MPTATPDAPLSSTWRTDLPAAAVVFLVSVPLCLGIALASGAPLFAGIIAGIVGGMVVGALSGSPLMISGPAAGLSAVVLTGMQALGSFEAFLVAVVLAGLMQLALAAVRAGVVGYYVPTSVVKGMLSGIGVILILKQVPHAIGYDVDAMGDVAFRQLNQENTFTALAGALRHLEWGAVVISVAALLLLSVWRRIGRDTWRRVPGPLVAILLGIALNETFARVAPSLALTGSHLVTLPVPDTPGAFFSQFTFPAFGMLTDGAVWRLALTVAAVASLESLLALEATHRLDPGHRDVSANRELAAQGAGNVVSGLLGGLPVTGLVIRTAANIEAGAISRTATILQGALLFVLAAVLAPALINHVPLAAIAAVLVHLGARLVNPRVAREEWSFGRSHAIPFFATVVAIVLTDLLIGIVVGLSVGVLFILRDQLQSPPFTEVSPPGAVLRRLQLNENVNFLHRAAIVAMLDGLPSGSRVELDGRGMRRIDADALEAITRFRTTARARGIDYRLVGIPDTSVTAEHAVPRGAVPARTVIR